MTSHAKEHTLGDYCDGDHFKNHKIFSVDNRALQMQLYYDEMDVCNPIGSKAGVHKLGKTTSVVVLSYWLNHFVTLTMATT